MLVVYGAAQLGPAVRAAVRMRSGEFAALGLLLSCLSAADDLAELRLLGIVSVGIVASAGVISLLLLSLDDAKVTAVPVDDTGRSLSLPASEVASDRLTHLRVLQVAVGSTTLGTLTA
jgi:hypothetical protein